MAWADAATSIEELAGFVKTFDREKAATWCAGLISRAIDTEEPFPAVGAAKVLSSLRANRWMDLVEDVAHAFVQTGVELPTVRRQYAQALIEGGRLLAAVSVLRALVAGLPPADPETGEAQGLLGRCYKQMYVESGNPGFARNRELIRESVAAYSVGYDANPDENLWHGINVVAMLARAKRDGVDIEGAPSPDEVAEAVLARVRAKFDSGVAHAWDLGTGMEASLALGNDGEALEWLGRYVQTDAGSFEFSGTLRQLEEVWQLKPEGGRGAMLSILRSAILSREGGRVGVDPTASKATDAALESVPAPILEKVLGTTGMQSLKWYRDGLTRAEAVARICDSTGKGVGTGFLLAGSEISEKLPADEMFVITNAHVVSETVSGALFPDEAAIGFEAVGEDAGYTVKELIFTSPPDQLDVSILRLDKPAPKAERIPVAPRLPLNDGQQRLYVIGHPEGGGLSFSLQDNLLLDVEVPKLHYHTPTEPGSSGSPVFNAQWKLVALHHAGSLTMPRLNGAAGTYAANEGLWIQSIKEALDEALTAK